MGIGRSDGYRGTPPRGGIGESAGTPAIGPEGSGIPSSSSGIPSSSSGIPSSSSGIPSSSSGITLGGVSGSQAAGEPSPGKRRQRQRYQSRQPKRYRRGSAPKVELGGLSSGSYGSSDVTLRPSPSKLSILEPPAPQVVPSAPSSGAS